MDGQRGDPGPGTRRPYRVVMREGVEAAGEFVEVDPPHRLVFTWGWAHDQAVPPGSTRVVVTLEAEDGGTRVVLRHHDLPDDGQREHHRLGWQMYLGRLGVSAPGRHPDPTPTPNRCRGPCIAPDNGHGLIATAPVQEGLPMPEGRRLSWAEVRVAVLTVACCPSSACG